MASHANTPIMLEIVPPIPAGSEHCLTPDEVAARQSRRPTLCTTALNQADSIPCSPVKSASPARAKGDRAKDMPRGSNLRSAPSLQRRRSEQPTNKVIKRCRAAASTSPTMATLWLTQSEVASILDAVGLPLNPDRDIEFRECPSRASVCYRLLGSVVGGINRTQRNSIVWPSMSRARVIHAVGTMRIEEAPDSSDCASKEEHASVAEAWYVEMATSLSVAARRLCLMSSDALPIRTGYGNIAPDYLARLIHGPQGGQRVPMFLLHQCDKKVMGGHSDQVGQRSVCQHSFEDIYWVDPDRR